MKGVKSSKWPLIWACTIVALAVGASIAGSFFAGQDDASDPEPAAEPVDVAVEFYALDYSVTQEEARLRLDRIDEVQEILASIRDVEAERLAGWGIDHRGRFGGWVLLTGSEPASAAAVAVADAHEDIEIRTGARHGYTELLIAQGDLAADLYAAKIPATSNGELGNSREGEPAVPGVPGSLVGTGIEPDLAAVVTHLGIDMAGNAVDVGVVPALAPKIGPLGTVSELGFDQGAAIIANLLRDQIDVNFTIVEGRIPAPDASFQGGSAIYRQGYPRPMCTTGFTAKKLNVVSGYLHAHYDYGVITAGHCGDDGPTETVPFSMHGIELPFGGGHAGVRADAQFHKVPLPTSGMHDVLDDFFTGETGGYYPNLSYDVSSTAVRENMHGDYVCHYGINSGTTCGTVTDITHQPHIEDPPVPNPADPNPPAPEPDPFCLDLNGSEAVCESVFVKVEGPSLRACSGDSGGPWYRGQRAYGIHMGSEEAPPNTVDCTWGGQWAWFSAIDEVETFLGVSVLTEPITLNAP